MLLCLVHINVKGIWNFIFHSFHFSGAEVCGIADINVVKINDLRLEVDHLLL